MGAEASKISVVLWEKIEPSKAMGKFGDMLAEGEYVELSYIAKRDRLIFTNKRVLIINVQGLMGTKVDFHTIPYSKISSFSVETSGTFDLESELKLWISGLSGVEIQFIKGLDIREVGRYLTNKLI